MSEVVGAVAAPAVNTQVKSNTTTIAQPVDPQQNGTEIAEQPKSLSKRILKAHGQEIELDDEQYERYAQKGIGAEKRLWEANKLHKEAMAKAAEVEKEKARLEDLKKQFDGGEDEAIENLIRQAQNDPQKLGKVRQKVENWLIEQLKLEQATPEQQELAQLKRQMEMQKAEAETLKKQQEKVRFEAETQKYRELFSKKLMQGLEQSGLPATEWNVKHMADLQMQALKAGYDIDPTTLADMLKQDRIEHVRSLTGDISKNILSAYEAKDNQKILMIGQQLEAIAPPELLKALRIYDLAQINSQQPNVPKKPVEVAVPVDPDAEQRRGYKMSWAEAEAERKRTVAELERQFRSR